MKILYAPFARKMPHLNGTGSPKNYPWAKELAVLLEAEYEVTQVGGTEDEILTGAWKIGLPFDEVTGLIKECDTAVCVDSYLQHHMWYLGKRAVVLWGISDPLIFGHKEHVNLLRDRSFLRKNQYDLYYANEVTPEAFVTPDIVMKTLNGRGLSYDGQTA